jgi:hypothetical protein
MNAATTSANAGDMDQSAWARIWRSIGWPVLAGLTCVVLGLALLAAAALFFYQARRLHESSTELGQGNTPSITASDNSAPDAFVAQLPDAPTYLDDVAFIFKQAKERTVNIGAITYRSETSTSMPVVTHTMEMRLDEDYPKLKSFVAQLLGEMPHLYLDEIQVEQATGPRAANLGSKVQATLKLSLVYRKSASDGQPRPNVGKTTPAMR